MRLFALADPHLGLAVDKPMDVFGPRWQDHADRMAQRWSATVGPDDCVLVPGDISWGMNLDEALADLEYLDRLPGRRKVLLKGNHDFWWGSRAKVERCLPPTLELLQNDAVDLGDGLGLVGTRGWTPPGAPRAGEADLKIYEREIQRLRLSIEAAGDRFERLIAMLHYPPIYDGLGETGFVPLLREAGVETCVYGHLHGADRRYAIEGIVDGIRYYLVAADAIDFTPLEIPLGNVDGPDTHP